MRRTSLASRPDPIRRSHGRCTQPSGVVTDDASTAVTAAIGGLQPGLQRQRHGDNALGRFVQDQAERGHQAGGVAVPEHGCVDRAIERASESPRTMMPSHAPRRTRGGRWLRTRAEKQFQNDADHCAANRNMRSTLPAAKASGARWVRRRRTGSRRRPPCRRFGHALGHRRGEQRERHARHAQRAGAQDDCCFGASHARLLY